MERRLISVASFYMGSEEQASKTTASSQAAQASPVVERCLSLALLAPKKSSLSVFACQSPKSLHETDEMDPLSGIIGVGVVDDDGGDDDDEDDEEEAVETKDISRYQKHSSSWARISLVERRLISRCKPTPSCTTTATCSFEVR
jgi:hypothetical protein